MFLACITVVRAQDQSRKFTVTGIVMDDAGQPIAGASVMVKGSRTAVTAGVAGEFSILVAENDILVISYIGFQDKEVAVSRARKMGAIAMVKSDKSMNDVVVIGYGTQRRADITAAVASRAIISTREAL